jgi:hypothetical protein
MMTMICAIRLVNTNVKHCEQHLDSGGTASTRRRRCHLLSWNPSPQAPKCQTTTKSNAAYRLWVNSPQVLEKQISRFSPLPEHLQTSTSRSRIRGWAGLEINIQCLIQPTISRAYSQSGRITHRLALMTPPCPQNKTSQCE